MIPKRVAFVNGVPVDKGGIETSIMNVYRSIDRQQVQIDFIVRKPQEGYYHKEIRSLGGQVINLFENKNHKGNKKWNVGMDLYSIFRFYKYLKNNEYQAVHFAHPILDGLLILPAYLAHVPVRIVHSNNTGIDDYSKGSIIRKWTRKLRVYFSRKFATHIWGCSKAACEYLFGFEIEKDIRTEIVPYPVALKDFSNEQDCKQSRVKLDIDENKITFVNVGRYALQKNQLFLLDFFSKMLIKRPDLQLLLTGPGPLESEIKNKIDKLEISKSVFMLDSNTSIPLVLSASDFFLLPSIYEGFGIVLIEAQAMGIHCFVSNACQPEADKGLIDYIPLENGTDYWANYILEHITENKKRSVDIDSLYQYDIEIVGKRMQRVYLTGTKYLNN